MSDFFRSLLMGFLIAGILHVFVPQRLYARYHSRDNKASATRNTLTTKGPAPEATVSTAVEKAGYTIKGKKQ